MLVVEYIEYNNKHEVSDFKFIDETHLTLIYAVDPLSSCRTKIN